MATFMQLVQSDVKSISVSNWKVTHTRIGFICTCYNIVALFLLIQKREEKKLNISLSTFTCAEKSEAHRWREHKKNIQEDAWKLHRNCNCIYVCKHYMNWIQSQFNIHRRCSWLCNCSKATVSHIWRHFSHVVSAFSLELKCNLNFNAFCK